jgi:hypothetical protein
VERGGGGVSGDDLAFVLVVLIFTAGLAWSEWLSHRRPDREN